MKLLKNIVFMMLVKLLQDGKTLTLEIVLI